MKTKEIEIKLKKIIDHHLNSRSRYRDFIDSKTKYKELLDQINNLYDELKKDRKILEEYG